MWKGNLHAATGDNGIYTVPSLLGGRYLPAYVKINNYCADKE
jgi:hypothetical protein